MKKKILPIMILAALIIVTPHWGFSQQTRETFGFSYLKKTNDTDKYIEILETINNTDAKKSGLQSGDFIVEIEGQPIENLSDKKITDLIVAAKQKGALSLRKSGASKAFQLTIKTISTQICMSENCTSGKVKIVDVFNFYEYEGEFKNGNYNGKGTLSFTGISTNYPAFHFVKQSGTYANGYFLNGVTEYKYGKFEGKTYNGVPEGEGIYTDTGGTIYKGKFINGYISEGIMISKSSDGKTTETKFENGRPVKL